MSLLPSLLCTRQKLAADVFSPSYSAVHDNSKWTELKLETYPLKKQGPNDIDIAIDCCGGELLPFSSETRFDSSTDRPLCFFATQSVEPVRFQLLYLSIQRGLPTSTSLDHHTVSGGWGKTKVRLFFPFVESRSFNLSNRAPISLFRSLISRVTSVSPDTRSLVWSLLLVQMLPPVSFALREPEQRYVVPS